MDSISTDTATRTGGQILADALVAQGVTHAFCVPGESYLDVLDGLYANSDKIELVTCRFEAGAVNMAEAHGKLTGRPGVALVTRGPGACHAAIGVHVAMQDSTPLVLIVGQIPSRKPTAKASRKWTTAACSARWPSG
ncbi:thiamine pyrophosphate-binding protein [Pseudoroseomonas wenyumeiae]